MSISFYLTRLCEAYIGRRRRRAERRHTNRLAWRAFGHGNQSQY